MRQIAQSEGPSIVVFERSITSQRAFVITTVALLVINLCGIIPAALNPSVGATTSAVFILVSCLATLSFLVARRWIFVTIICVLLGTAFSPTMLIASAYVCFLIAMRGNIKSTIATVLFATVALVLGVMNARSFGVINSAPELVFLILGSASIAFAVATVAGWVVNLILKQDSALYEARKKLQRSKVLELENQASQNKLDIARYLHDKVSNNIASANLHLAYLLKQPELSPVSRSAAEAIQEATNDARQSLVYLLHQITEKTDDTHGIESDSIQTVTSKYQRVLNSHDMTLELDLDSNVPKVHEEYFTFIVNEALSNALKYGKQGEVTVVSSREENQSFLEVKNPVCSSIPNSAEFESSGIGIELLMKYVESIGGKLSTAIKRVDAETDEFILTCCFPD